jgi:hypothetical protein
MIPFQMDDDAFGADADDDFAGLGIGGSLTASVPSHGLGMDGGTMFNDIGHVDDSPGPSDTLPMPPRNTIKEEKIKREKMDTNMGAMPPPQSSSSIMAPPAQMGKGGQQGSSSTSQPICINSNSTAVSVVLHARDLTLKLFVALFSLKCVTCAHGTSVIYSHR